MFIGVVMGFLLIVLWYYLLKICYFNMILLLVCKLCIIYFGYKICFFFDNLKELKIYVYYLCILKKLYIYIILYIEWIVINVGCIVVLYN